MIKWFVEKAPIRQKLAIAFGFFCALLIGGGLAVYLADHQLAEAFAAQDLAAAKAVHEGMLAWAWTFSIGAVLVCIPAAWFFRRTISGPYIAPVIDMEALSAGNTCLKLSPPHYKTSA